LWNNVCVIDYSGVLGKSCIDVLLENHEAGSELCGRISAGVYKGTLYLVISTEFSGYNHQDLLWLIPIQALIECDLRPRGAFYRIDWTNKTSEVFGESSLLGPLWNSERNEVVNNINQLLRNA